MERQKLNVKEFLGEHQHRITKTAELNWNIEIIRRISRMENLISNNIILMMVTVVLVFKLMLVLAYTCEEIITVLCDFSVYGVSRPSRLFGGMFLFITLSQYSNELDQSDACRDTDTTDTCFNTFSEANSAFNDIYSQRLTFLNYNNHRHRLIKLCIFLLFLISNSDCMYD